jgi:hypothetical protein
VDQSYLFLFEQVREGYIVVFAINFNKLFNSAKRKFAAGPRRRLLEEIPLWIKMLFMEKGITHMDPDRMVE